MFHFAPEEENCNRKQTTKQVTQQITGLKVDIGKEENHITRIFSAGWKDRFYVIEEFRRPEMVSYHGLLTREDIRQRFGIVFSLN